MTENDRKQEMTTSVQMLVPRDFFSFIFLLLEKIEFLNIFSQIWHLLEISDINDLKPSASSYDDMWKNQLIQIVRSDLKRGESGKWYFE